MSVSITTNDFVQAKKIKIDKYEWDFISPGAGLTLELSKLSREVASKKNASDEEALSLMEKIYEYYGSVFKDSTKDNSQVNEWLRKTPIDSLALIVQDINRQFNEGVAKSE